MNEEKVINMIKSLLCDIVEETEKEKIIVNTNNGFVHKNDFKYNIRFVDTDLEQRYTKSDGRIFVTISPKSYYWN